MTLNKWNYDIHDYEPYQVPNTWRVTVFESELDTIINCAECGKGFVYGDAYTSLIIHTKYGFGYAVCKTCYNEEHELKCKFREGEK